MLFYESELFSNCSPTHGRWSSPGAHFQVAAHSHRIGLGTISPDGAQWLTQLLLIKKKQNYKTEEYLMLIWSN